MARLKYFERFKQERQKLIDKVRFDPNVDLDNDQKLRQALINHELLVEENYDLVYCFPPIDRYPSFNQSQRTIRIDVPESIYPNFYGSQWIEVNKDSPSLFHHALCQVEIFAKHEIGMMSGCVGWLKEEPDCSGYLILNSSSWDPHPNGESANYQVIGGGVVDHQINYNVLRFIWLYPSYRGGRSNFELDGRMAWFDFWSHLCRLDKPLYIAPPYSKAMKRFLEKKENECKESGKEPRFEWDKNLWR